MPTVVIVGASRGLGYEFARQYAQENWQVIATVRDPVHAKRVRNLGSSVEVLQADLLKHSTLKNIHSYLAGRPVDHLICNGAIYGPLSAQLGTIDYEAWDLVLRTNVMGHTATVEALLSNVMKSAGKLIVFMSSRYASIEWHAGDDYIYRSSKAALNSVARGLAKHLLSKGVIVVPVSPGWVDTDMGGPHGKLTAQESVRYLRELFDQLTLRDSGKFLNYDGTAIPW